MLLPKVQVCSSRLGEVDAVKVRVLQSYPGARGAPHGDEARPNCRRLLYMAANGFYLADGRGGRSFFVVLSYQAAYSEQSIIRSISKAVHHEEVITWIKHCLRVAMMLFPPYGTTHSRNKRWPHRSVPRSNSSRRTVRKMQPSVATHWWSSL